MRNKLPNIIMIVMDTVGAKHMSLYGYERKTTPNLDKFAENSTVYTRCFAPACWTIPSHASMFTGLYPSQHGAFEGMFYLSENIQHLVPALKMAGYQTLGITSNSLVSPSTGLCRSFDSFHDLAALSMDKFINLIDADHRTHDELDERLTKGASIKEKIEILFGFIIEKKDFKTVFKRCYDSIYGRINNIIDPTPLIKSSRFTKKTLEIFRDFVIHQNTDKLFFLFINFLEAHEMYTPPWKWRKYSKWSDRQGIVMEDFFYKEKNDNIDFLMNIYCKLYDDELIFLDYIIENIHQEVSKTSFYDNTIIIITSDHGEHFGEKEIYGHFLSLYNELIWVPLIIKYPKEMNKIGIDDRLVSLNDIYTTILELISSPLPNPQTSQSLLGSGRRDFVISQHIYPELYKLQIGGKKKFFNGYAPPVMAVMTDGGRKIIENRNGELEVYNLTSDKDETHNLINTMPAEALENFRAMMNFIKVDTGFDEAFEQVKKSRMT